MFKVLTGRLGLGQFRSWELRSPIVNEYGCLLDPINSDVTTTPGEGLMSPQTETKASVGFKAGVKDYKLTYYTPEYETKDTDILAAFRVTPQPGVPPEEAGAAVAAESSTGHPWGNAPGAAANRVALEACVQARNEGRDLAREATAEYGREH
ncbi:hypothetical protein U9M48_034419 [Paspalum notatum var. saurae]|uniref:Ribulose bisphosphate carboxylase large chain n=1 Tax=Paspalum notatum var. saurae TaxID=547442 RepID=A0AAQ3UAH1_PASNO